MSHSSSIIINPPSARKFSRGTPSSDSQLSRYVSHLVMSFRSGVTQPSGSIPPIHILDDDSLLIIFSLYRLVILVGADIGVRASNSGPPEMGRMDLRVLVARALTCLPAMVQAHIRVSILPGTLPCLYVRHIRGKDARVLPPPSHRPQLSPYRSQMDCAKQGWNTTCASAPHPALLHSFVCPSLA